MPILIYIWTHEVDGNSHVIGVCEYTKREEFEKKAKALCEAMDLMWSEVTTHNGYLGSTLATLP